MYIYEFNSIRTFSFHSSVLYRSVRNYMWSEGFSPFVLLYSLNILLSKHVCVSCFFDSKGSSSNHLLDHELLTLTGIDWLSCFFNVQIMAAEVCYHAIGTSQSHSYLNNLNHHQNLRTNSVRLVAKDFICSNGFSKRGSSHSGRMNLSVIRSSASHSQISVADPVLSPSRSSTGDTSKKSSKINFPVNYIYWWTSLCVKHVYVDCFLKLEHQVLGA